MASKSFAVGNIVRLKYAPDDVNLLVELSPVTEYGIVDEVECDEDVDGHKHYSYGLDMLGIEVGKDGTPEWALLYYAWVEHGHLVRCAENDGCDYVQILKKLRDGKGMK